MSQPGALSAASPAAGAQRRLGPVLLLLALLAAGVVQEPALVDSFRAGDDWVHLYQIVDHGLWWFSMTQHGNHLLMTSNLAWYLCHAIFGLHAQWYYLVALLTHLLNVYLLFRLIQTSCGRPGLAFLAALLWGTSGLCQAPIGWFSAYGHVLAATFVLWFLGDVARLDRAGRRISGWILGSWILLLLLASTSFGTGIGVAMLAGPAVYLLMPEHPDRRRAALAMGSMVLLLPAVYLFSTWIASRLPFAIDADYAATAATLAPSAWLDMVSLLAVLIGYGSTSLLAGPFVSASLSGVLLGPLTGTSLETLAWLCGGFSLALLAACGWALRGGSGPERRRVIGYALLAVGAYGLVSVGRAAFFASLSFPFSLAAVQSRYHYLGQALLAVALALAAAALPLPRRPASHWLRALGLAGLVLVVGLQRISAQVVEQLQPPQVGTLFEEVVTSIRAAVAARPAGSEVRIENRPFLGTGFVNTTHFADQAAVFVIAFPSNEVDGRRVVFVERDPRRRHFFVERIPGTRLSRLLVAPEPGEAAPPPPAETGSPKPRRRRVAPPGGSS